MAPNEVNCVTLKVMAQEREQKFFMEASDMAKWQAGSAALLQWSQRSRTPQEMKNPE